MNGKIYVVGGFGGQRELEIYDPSADRWTRGSAIPRALHHAAVVGWGGNGWRGRNTPAHETYDPAANRWIALASVPTGRDHLAVAATDGRLYAVGGRVEFAAF